MLKFRPWLTGKFEVQILKNGQEPRTSITGYIWKRVINLILKILGNWFLILHVHNPGKKFLKCDVTVCTCVWHAKKHLAEKFCNFFLDYVTSSVLDKVQNNKCGTFFYFLIHLTLRDWQSIRFFNLIEHI